MNEGGQNDLMDDFKRPLLFTNRFVQMPTSFILEIYLKRLQMTKSSFSLIGFSKEFFSIHA